MEENIQSKATKTAICLTDRGCTITCPLVEFVDR